VWVDADGACQNGHDAECVGGIYDAEEKLPSIEPVTPDFGSGEFPPPLDQFNWAAFLLPLPWGVAFGAWSVVALWVLMVTGPLAVAFLVLSFGEEVLEANALLVGLVGEFISGAIRLWIGANATRLLWTREQLRMQMVEGSKPRFGVSRYLARQKTWTYVGIWLTVIMLVGVGVIAFSTDPQLAAIMEAQRVRSDDALLSGFFLLAEIGLGLWLAAKMRAENSGVRPPSQEM
jgi:hypothetical protein